MTDREAMKSALSSVFHGVVLVLALSMIGCGPVRKATDWLTGADKPAVQGEDADGDGVPDKSAAGKAIDLLESTGPLGAAGSTILAFLVGGHVARRREKLAKEAAKNAGGAS